MDAWLNRSARDLATESLVQLFATALGALWARTLTTLGEVTLTAIAERVVHNAAQRFPLFATLDVDPIEGIQCGRLREAVASAPGAGDGPALRAGIRFVLVEFLTVVGNLTAEILTPQLHAALVRVELPKAARPKKGAQRGRAEAKGRVKGQGRTS